MGNFGSTYLYPGEVEKILLSRIYRVRSGLHGSLAPLLGLKPGGGGGLRDGRV